MHLITRHDTSLVVGLIAGTVVIFQRPLRVVWEAAWKGAGNDGPPEFHGFQYFHRIDNPVTTYADEAHLFEPHYELHMWLYEENPTGVFAQFNPRVSCEYHDGPKTMAEAMARMQAAQTSAGEP